MIRKWMMMSPAVAACWSAFALPDIQLVADGATGEYCGVGYGISVNVSTPSSGYTVKYAESATGPWVDDLKYVNVCAAKPIYYQVTATGYTTATGSANVTITPKELTEDYIWLMMPAEGYVYDGTAKEPEVSALDGEPSIITDADWEVSYSDNVNAGTATATFTGKGNYTGTCTEEFEIAKTENSWTTEPSLEGWIYGQTASAPVGAARIGTMTVVYSSGAKPTMPGNYTATFTVPESQNYKELTKTVEFTVRDASIQYVADGVSGEYCGTGYRISVSVSRPATGATVRYAETPEGPWMDDLAYTNACNAKAVYFQIVAEGFTTATGSANVTVSPKTLTEDYVWGVYPTQGYSYDGSEKRPETACGDGEPSIITGDDFAVSYVNNINAGTAKIVFTGKNNYAGTVEEEFEILGQSIVGPDVKLAASPVYTGAMQTQGILSVRYNGQLITYVVTGNTGTEAGAYNLVVKGTGNYVGAVTCAWEIVSKELDSSMVGSIPAQTFTGVALTPVPSVKDGTVVLTRNVDYALSYQDNVAPGQATVVVKGLGNYAGEVVRSFTIGSAAGDALGTGFGGVGEVEWSGDGWCVSVTNDVPRTILIGDSLGKVTIDLKGHNLIGAAGTAGTTATRGGDGAPAILIRPEEGAPDGEPTQLTIVDSVPDDTPDVIGGAGGNGVPPGNGGAGIKVSEDAAEGVIINIGPNVTVKGGAGGHDLSGQGKDGESGPAVQGTVGTVSGEIEKVFVEKPTIVAKPYTGSLQTATVPASTRWTVVFNYGGTAVGRYAVGLRLTDAVNYAWKDANADDDTVFVPFDISKAVIDTSTVRWNYSAPIPYTAYEQAVELIGLPEGVTATYTGNRATEAGTYTARAVLNYNTDNYTAASMPDLVWTIKPAVPIEGGNADPLGGSTINYSGVYDGEGHGISVILRDPRPAGAKVLYARTEKGPYGAVNPVFTNVCRQTIWYTVSADNYETLTNSATVVIDAKPFTSALLKGKGLKDDGKGGVVPNLVFEDALPCILDGNSWELVSWTPGASGGGMATVRGKGNYSGRFSVEIGNEMVVTFDAVYGDDISALRTVTTQVPGQKYVLPATVPLYRGHAFLGWFTARTGGTPVTAANVVRLTDNDVLYAHWSIKTYAVRLEPNGGAGVSDDPLSFDYGATYKGLPVPVRPGYHFCGWYSSPEFDDNTLVENDDAVKTQDLTLYAKWLRRVLWYTDATFHLEKATVYSGYLLDADERITGSIEVKAGKPNMRTGLCKLTAKIVMVDGKKVSAKGETYDGSAELKTRDGRTVKLQLGVNAMRGMFEDMEIDGARDVFSSKDADSKIRAAQVLNQWRGTYIVVADTGTGYVGLSLVVGVKGKIKLNGSLSDGTKVSCSAKILVGESENAIAIAWGKRGKELSFLVWFGDAGMECSNLGELGESAFIANAREGAYLQKGAVFQIDTRKLRELAPQAFEEAFPNGVAVTDTNGKWSVPPAGRLALGKDGLNLDPEKLGDNPSGLKLSYRLNKGTFSGSFSLAVLDNGRLKKVKASVTGVVVGTRGYGTATIPRVGSVPVVISAD